MTPCALCGHPFEQDKLGPYGCPNCLGEGLEEPPPVTTKEVEMDDVDLIAARFEKFHARRPEIYELLLRLALELKDKGWPRYGISALVEVVRHQYAMRDDPAEPLKLNNNYAALYARLLEQQEPKLRGFFAKRARGRRGMVGQIVRPGDSPSPPVDCWDRPLSPSNNP